LLFPFSSSHALLQPGEEDDSASSQLRYRVGDLVEAKWLQDEEWYEAAVSEIDDSVPDAPLFLVVFQEYSNDQICDFTRLRKRVTGHVFALNDECLGRWVEDDKEYPVRVVGLGMLEGICTYEIQFIEYGNRQKCTEDYLRPHPQDCCAVCSCYKGRGAVCGRCGAAIAMSTEGLAVLLADLERKKQTRAEQSRVGSTHVKSS
jgi:hypothetical protein